MADITSCSTQPEASRVTAREALERSRSKDVVALLALVALAGVVLAPIFWVGLLCDDYQYWLVGVQGNTTWDAITGIQGARNRPLTTAALVVLLGNLADVPWLLGGIRLVHHVLNAVLLAIACKRAWGATQNVARIAAVAFLVWCTHAEVFWQSSLHDVLAASFVLLACILASCTATRAVALALVLVSFLAFWSKESAWALPALLVMTPLIQPAKKTRWRAWWGFGIVTIVFALCFCLRLAWVGDFWGEVIPTSVESSTSFRQVTGSLSKEIFRSLVPGWINAHTVANSIKPVIGGLAALFVSLVVVAFVHPRLRGLLVKSATSPLGVAALAYVASLAPVAKLSVSIETTENLRYLYLPTAFLAVTVAFLWDRLRHWHAKGALALLVVVLAFNAGSLHALGWKWVRATHITNEYRAALEALVRARATSKRLVVACVPDNYEGAFAARNISPHVAAALSTPGQPLPTYVVANRYVDNRSDANGCSARQQDGTLRLYVNDQQFALTHPGFYDRQNPVVEGGWTIHATDMQNFRAQQLHIEFRGLSAEDTVAFYDGKSFVVLDSLAGSMAHESRIGAAGQEP